VTSTTDTTSLASFSQGRPPLWRNATLLKWLLQIVVLLTVLAGFWFLITQARTNLDAKGIPVGYDWLDDPSNFQLGDGIQTVDSPERRLTMSRALWVGMVNTFRVAIAGIIFSTILGVLIGIARLSKNYVARKVSSIYVETLRNIPVLVQIIFWLAILGSLGSLTTDTGPIKGWVIVSQKGISIPRVFLDDGFYQFLALFLVLFVGIWFVRRRMIAAQERLGGNQRVGWKTFGLVTGALVISWFANPIMSFLGPVFGGIEDAWGSIPQGAMQIVLCVLAVGAAVWRIKKFLDSRRTPAGLAKLIDDDWFRLIFTGLAALIAIFVVLRLWPGLSSWIVNSGRDFFGVIADKFGDGRGSQPFDGMKPSLSDGRFVNFAPTGLTMSVFYASLFFGLVFYTSAFIAEVVRGGILAVPSGQAEAAAALGLSRGQALRKVILPQAFRVIMPPLGNQYLNITKNTSLGIAVGFSEIVQVGQTVYNKNSQTLAVFSIYMMFFLACSLTISSIVNYINRRLAIVER
jgi:His/Glu/Gln/Arg/opine family amino acid ABC transporter permease subunit